jgi:DNA end-binding protein Ku
MFRRSKIDRVKGHAATASDVALQLAQDKKFRKQLLSAAAHSSAAARRTRGGFGLLSALTRLATDERLANELKSARADLQNAYGRLETKKHGHKLRNAVLVVAAASAAGVPKVRATLMSAFTKGAAQRDRLTNAVGGNNSTARPHSLDDLTKEELYQRAQEADIAGRSDMTKDQLVAALRQQG